MPFSIFRELEKVRNLPGIKLLWESVGSFGFRARCWGRKPKGFKNPFGGSHIFLFNGTDAVDVFQRPENGEFVVLQFTKVQKDTGKIASGIIFVGIT